MLYTVHEMQRSWLNMASTWASVGSEWLSNPALPFGYSGMGPVMASALVEQEARLARGDIDAIVETAASFNVLLADAAHNEVLRAMIQSFVTLMVERGPRVYLLDGFGEGDLQEHTRLHAAVRDQDPDLAARLMREHIEELARRYRAVGAA